MEQVQAIAAERDEARSEATRLREGGGIEDLQEKQQAIAAIIRSEMQSWEEPARVAKKNASRNFWERMYFPMLDFYRFSDCGWVDLLFFLWKAAWLAARRFFGEGPTWNFAKGQAEKSRWIRARLEEVLWEYGCKHARYDGHDHSGHGFRRKRFLRLSLRKPLWRCSRRWFDLYDSAWHHENQEIWRWWRGGLHQVGWWEHPTSSCHFRIPGILGCDHPLGDRRCSSLGQRASGIWLGEGQIGAWSSCDFGSWLRFQVSCLKISRLQGVYMVYGHIGSTWFNMVSCVSTWS